MRRTQPRLTRLDVNGALVCVGQRKCHVRAAAEAALSPGRLPTRERGAHKDMVKHDSVRIVVGDELGYTRCAQSADSTATAFSVVARWGQGARAAGVERLSTAHGNDEDPSSWVAGASRPGASQFQQPPPLLPPLLRAAALPFYTPLHACSLFQSSRTAEQQ